MDVGHDGRATVAAIAATTTAAARRSDRCRAADAGHAAAATDAAPGRADACADADTCATGDWRSATGRSRGADDSANRHSAATAASGDSGTGNFSDRRWDVSRDAGA